MENEEPEPAAWTSAVVNARWTALVLGAVGLALAGARLLASSDAVGLIYLTAAPLTAVLAHRRVLPALVGLGVAAHSASEVYLGNPVAAVGVVAGLAASIVAVGPPGPSLDPWAWLRRLRELTASPVPRPVMPVAASASAAGPAAGQVMPTVATDVAAAQARGPGSAAREELEVLPSPAPEAPAQPQGQQALDGRVSWETVGRLRLCIGDRDATSVLADSKTTTFLVLYQVAWAAAFGSLELSREALASEMYEGFTKRREPLKHVVHAVRNELPPPLSECFDLRRGSVRFLPERCDWDVTRFRRLETVVGADERILAKPTLEAIEHELSKAGNGVFLPGFEELAEDVTRTANSKAVRTVGEARRQLDQTRAHLALALDHSYRQMGQTVRAIPVLKQELRRQRFSEELRKALIRAYVESGQPEQAQRVEAREDDSEEDDE